MPVEKTSRLWFLVGVSLWFVFAVNVSAADCNFNGIDDMEDINSASSEDCNESGIPDECELAPFAFGSRDRGIELDSLTNVAAAADFNGDGVSDLATGHENSTLSVILSQGDETFEEVMTIRTSKAPRSIAVADLYGDADLDLVVAVADFRGLLQTLENNGDGTFNDPVASPAPVGADAVVAGDVTGDGVADVIAIL